MIPLWVFGLGGIIAIGLIAGFIFWCKRPRWKVEYKLAQLSNPEVVVIEETWSFLQKHLKECEEMVAETSVQLLQQGMLMVSAEAVDPKGKSYILSPVQKLEE